MSPGLRRRLAHALDRRFEALHHRVEGVANDVAGLREEVARAQADVARLARRLDDEISPTLRILAGRDAENRRLLAEARSDPEYELAFTAPNPLVTVVLPTYRRPGLLRTRSLPAALAQKHERLEVLVIGDGPDPEAEQVVRELDEGSGAVDEPAAAPRLPGRAAPLARELDAGAERGLPAGARRLAVRLRRRRLDAIALLLEAARERRAEAVQGVIREQRPDGSTRDEAAALPNRLPLKGALVHAHLRFFEREHVASALGIAGDRFRGERMLRAGVRIELVERVTYDYYPVGPLAAANVSRRTSTAWLSTSCGVMQPPTA
ncbi:MAG TPA: glycosyltransferase [Gaiellaceae bacterium]|nr:glycosyltransferase [Gaiellaceae bacterium]